MKTKNSFDKHIQRTAGICGFKFSKKKKKTMTMIPYHLSTEFQQK